MDVLDANVNQSNEKIKNTDDIITMIIEGHVDQMCILAHPSRWNDNTGRWLKELVWQNIKNIGKAILVKRAYYGKNK